MPVVPHHLPVTVGLVLAGGQARRLGGFDKALACIGGTPSLHRALDSLRPACAALAISGNGDGSRFAAGLAVVADDVPGFAGPLAGLLAGLDWTAAHRPDALWLVSAPADCPFLPADLVPRLHAARIEAGADLALAASGGRSHPVVGLWPVTLRHALRQALQVEGERKVGRFAARHRIALAEWPAEPRDPFFNVNTPEDLAEAQRLASLTPTALTRPASA